MSKISNEGDVARLLETLESFPDSYVIWDKDLRFVTCNQKYRELRPDLEHLLTPEFGFEDLVRARAESGLQPNAIGREEEWIAERINVLKTANSDYEILLGDKWYRIFQKRLSDGGIVAFQIEISSQRAREKALAESEEKYRALIEFCPDAVYIHDGLNMMYANSAGIELFGADSEDQIIGRDALAHVPPEFTQIVKNRMQGIFDTGISAGRVPQEYLRFDGSRINVEAQGIPIDFQNKRAILVIARDISERVEAEKLLREASDKLEGMVEARTSELIKEIDERRVVEEELKQAKEVAELANRSKTEFLANMSHELRSPLTAILGFTESMQQQIFGPIEIPKYLEYLDNIRTSGEHLHELINDILDVSAIESGNLSLHEDVVDIDSLMDATLRMVKPRAEAKGVNVTKFLENSLLKMRVDSRRIKQILVNLLSNAVKFSSEGDEVKLTIMKSESGDLRFEISDNGIGMDPVGMDLALTKFGQVESDLARNYDGSGLGLPLSKGLAEVHGGTLSIESKLGEGTVVTVELPHDRIED